MKVKILLLLFSLIYFESISAQKDTILSYTNTIYFDFGKSEIRTSEISKLKTLIQTTQSKPQGYLELSAHTDAIGKEDKNLNLSDKRMNSVIDFLMQNQIPPIYFKSNSYGEQRHIVDNNSEENRQLNRRVELRYFSFEEKEFIRPPQEKEIPNGAMVHFIIKDDLSKELIDCNIESKEKEYATFEKGKCDAWFEVENGNTLKKEFSFFKKGYFYSSVKIKLNQQEKDTVTIHLIPIKVGAKLKLELNFVGGKTVLVKKSFPELERLKKTIEMNPDATFEIGGHMNSPYQYREGDVEKKHPINYGFGGLLSTSRARKIYNYLVDHGIDGLQISYEGYGNKEMIFTNPKNEKQSAANRRVELKVTSVGNTVR